MRIYQGHQKCPRVAILLMENSSGLRPYQIEWYEKVFLGAFNAKTTADFKTVKNQVVTENIIAVTTEQLAQKTKEVYQRVITLVCRH